MQTSSAPTSRPVAPDPELIAWLWSEEGALWHKKSIKQVRHGLGVFAEVKDDHECSCVELCHPQNYSPHPDSLIFRELQLYGIYGIPKEWKRPERRC